MEALTEKPSTLANVNDASQGNGKYQLLVADGDPAARLKTVNILKKDGLKVLEARNGSECLKKAVKVQPALILLNEDLPDIPGTEICRCLKKNTMLADTYVVLVSNGDSKSDCLDEKEPSQADCYMTRPISHREIISRVNGLLRLRKSMLVLREQNEKLTEQTNHFREVNEKLQHEVNLRKKIQRVIHGISRMKERLLNGIKLGEKLQLITDEVVQLFDAEFARIWITKPGDRCELNCVHACVEEGPHVCREKDLCLHLMASSGIYTHLDGEVHQRVPFGCYKIGRVASAEDIKFITNDVVNDSRIHDHDWAEKLGLKSFAGYRLLSNEGEPIGVLALFSKNIISQEEDALLEDIAATASHVIQTSLLEEAQRKTEANLRRAQQVAHFGSWVWNTGTHEMEMSDELYRILGMKKEDGVPPLDPDAKMIHPEDREKVKETITRGLNERKSYTVDYRFYRPDNGEMRYLHVETEIEEIPGSDALIVFGTVQDVTDQKLAEAALLESQNFNVTLLNTSPDVIYIYDLIERKNVYSTEGLIKILGYSTEEAKEMGEELLSKLMHPDDFQNYLDRIVPCYAKAKDGVLIEHEYRMKHRDDHWIWLRSRESIFQRLSDGTPKQLFGVVSDITDKKKAEEELRQSEERYRNILEHTKDTFYLVRKDATLSFVTPQVKEILGYTPDEVTDKKFTEFLTDNPINKTGLAIVEKVFKEGIRPDLYTLAFRHKKGHEVLLQIDQSPQKDKAGTVVAISGAARDITEYKRAEEALRKSEDKYRSMIMNLMEGFYSATIDGTLLDYNNASCEIFGLDPNKNYVGVSVPDFWEDVNDREDFLKEMSRNGFVKDYVAKGVKANGEKFISRINARLIKDDDGQPLRTEGTFLDITESKQAEEKLRHLNQFRESIIDNANIWLNVLDENANVVIWNRAAEKISGYTRDEVVGHGKIWEWVYPDEKYRAEITEKAAAIIQENEVVENFETSIRRKDGDQRIISWYSRNLLDEKGNPIGSIAIGRDVTESKKADEQIKQSLREKEILLKEVHHRVKNNLQIMSSLLNIQSTNVGDEHLSMILSESISRIRSMALVHEIMYQNQDFAQIDMDHYLKKRILYLATLYSIDTSKIKIKSTCQNVVLDLNKAIPCGMILNELISNAMKHAYNNGDAGKIEICLEEKNDAVHVSVRDNGKALPKDFDPSNKESLGLSFVQDLAAQLEGDFSYSQKKSYKVFKIIF